MCGVSLHIAFSGATVEYRYGYAAGAGGTNVAVARSAVAGSSPCPDAGASDGQRLFAVNTAVAESICSIHSTRRTSTGIYERAENGAAYPEREADALAR